MSEMDEAVKREEEEEKEEEERKEKEEKERKEKEEKEGKEKEEKERKEKEEKEMEIVELNRRAEAALATARVVQERQTEQETVRMDERINDRLWLKRKQHVLKQNNAVSLC